MLTAAEIIKRMPSMGETDPAFLCDLMVRFPTVQEGFSDFVATPTLRRIAKAAEIANVMPREGWKRLEVDLEGNRDVLATHRGEYYGDRWLVSEDAPKSIETIIEHSTECAEFYGLVFERDPDLQFGMEVLKFHDFGEPVMNADFKPSDRISKDEKRRLELLATELLTESRLAGDLLAQHVYNCINIFEGNIIDFKECQKQMLQMIGVAFIANPELVVRNPAIVFLKKLYEAGIEDIDLLRKRAKEIDSIQMLFRGSRIIAERHSHLPQAEAVAKIEEFWDYVAPKLVTTEAKRFYDSLCTVYRLRMGSSYRQILLDTLQEVYNRKYFFEV